MKKILGYLLLGLLVAVVYGTYTYFLACGGSPEEVVLSNTNTVLGVSSHGNISDGSYTNYTTLEGINEAGASDLFTITASQIKPTELYIRKGWVSPIQQESRRSGRRRRRQVDVEIPLYSEFSLTKREYVTPIYAITLADGKEIGAVIDSKYISMLEKGESVTLPIGKRLELSNELSAFFADPLNGGAQISSVYYALNDSWFAANASDIERNAIIYAVIVAVVLGGLLYYFAGNLLFDKKDEDED